MRTSTRGSLLCRAVCFLTACGAFSGAIALEALSDNNAQALVSLQVKGHEAVAVSVITESGKSGRAVAAARQLGGRVEYHFEPADFVSVVLPRGVVQEFLARPFIQAAGIDDIERDYRFQMPEAPSVPGDVPSPPELSAYPLEKPHDIKPDIDAGRFLRDNPTFDGRGVVIAQVEGFSDMLVPEMQTALDLKGRPVPKFLDVINNPESYPTLKGPAERRDWQWVRLGAPQTPRAGKLHGRDQSYVAPTPTGRYRLGWIDVPTYVLTPLNLPGRAEAEARKVDHISLTLEREKGNTETFAVVWSDDRRAAWLDTDRDGDFSDERPVREYRTSFDIGVLGEDDPGTARRESRGYTIQKDGDYLSVNLHSHMHATMVAGVAAASKGSEGLIEGVARGAQVIAISHGSSYSGFAWALIQAFSDERSDIVLVEGQYPLCGGEYIKDGRSVLALLTSRLSQRYRKPSFWTASNEASMSSIMDPSIAPETISVGAFDSAEALGYYHGMKMPWRDLLHFIGSEGPAGNGALKPDLLSPMLMVAPRDRFQASDVFSGVLGLYRLPPGYAVSAGTSAATPIATGAAALLVSAAKQQGLPYDALSVKRALLASARYMPRMGAYQQGAGVIQVGAAWRQLQAQTAAGKPLSIEVVAPVRTANSHLLETPHQGVGIFEREGWRAGEKAVRRVKLTRRNGPSGSMRFAVRWRGNLDGTFSAPAEVDLPLGQPMWMDVAIAPAKEGVYSAVVELIHDSQPDPAVRVPVTVVVPYELNAANGYAQDLQVEMRTLGREAIFVRVPEGVDALRIQMAHNRRWALGLMHDPAGRQQGRTMTVSTVTGKVVETIPTPEAGVWGLFFWDVTGKWEYFKGHMAHANDRDVPPPVKLRLHISAATVSVSETSATSGEEGDVVHTLNVHNRLASLEQARLVGKPAHVRQVQGQLTRGERQEFDIQMPEGADLLVAEVRAAGGERLNADLYVFDCTSGKCSLVQESRSYRAEERVYVHRPRSGRWKVILDAGFAREARMQYEYRDFYTTNDAGDVSSTDRPVQRAVGAQWEARIKPWIFGTPASERQLALALYVEDAGRTRTTRPETYAENFGCETYPYCDSDLKDVVPLGLTLISLEPSQSGRLTSASVREIPRSH